MKNGVYFVFFMSWLFVLIFVLVFILVGVDFFFGVIGWIKIYFFWYVFIGIKVNVGFGGFKLMVVGIFISLILNFINFNN